MLNRRRFPHLAASLTVASAVVLPAQSGQQPAAALLAGSVTDAATGEALDDVVVSLEPVGSRADQSLAVLTDERGRFVFRNVRPGAYAIRAVRRGYMPGAFGVMWPRMEMMVPEDASQRTFEVRSGDRLVDLSVKLWPFGSISGRVVDHTGEPIVGMTVRLLSTIVAGGRRTLTFESWQCGGSCHSVTTDDRGVYRFGQLAPGEYVVAVPSVITTTPLALQPLVAGHPQPPEALTRTGAGAVEWLGGGGVGARTVIRMGDDHVAIGYVGSRSHSIAALTGDGELSIYPTTFYPATTRLADAARVRIGPGERRTDVHFALSPTATSTVRGVLRGASGPLADYVLRLVPVDQDALLSDPEISAAVSDADGSFVFAGVPPGDYWIRSLRRQPTVVPGRTAPPDRPRAEYGNARVSVGPGGVADVSVAMATLAQVSGRVQFETATAKPSPTPPAIYIERLDGRRLEGTAGSSARPNDRLEFESDGRLPGRYLVQVPFEPAGWFLRSAMLDGLDVTVQPFEIATADVRNVVVTFSDRPSTVLTGVVLDRTGRAVRAASVLAFPSDPRDWRDTGRYARRLKEASTRLDGTFTMRNLPPGDYQVVALGSSEPLLWRDPAVLGRLSKVSTRISLGMGATASVRLEATAGGGR